MERIAIFDGNNFLISDAPLTDCICIHPMVSKGVKAGGRQSVAVEIPTAAGQLA